MNALIKVMYLLPAVLITLLYGFLWVVFGEMSPFGWVYPLLYWLAAVMLLKGKWWGCIPGIVAGFLIAGGFRLNQSLTAYIYHFYYVLMGMICYKSNNKQ